MTTNPTAPSWNTFKGHGKPDTFLFFGMVRKAPKAQGTVCRMEKGTYSGYDVIAVETGEKVASFGSAGKFWAAPVEEVTEAAPVEEVTETAPVEERPTEDPHVALPAEAPKMTAEERDQHSSDYWASATKGLPREPAFPQPVCPDAEAGVPHESHRIEGTWREHCPGVTTFADQKAAAEAPAHVRDHCPALPVGCEWCTAPATVRAAVMAPTDHDAATLDDLLTDLAQWLDINDPATLAPVGAAHADPAHPHHRLAVRLADAARELFRVEEERDSFTSELIDDTCAMTAATGNLRRYQRAAAVVSHAERVREATARALAAEGELRARMADWARGV